MGGGGVHLRLAPRDLERWCPVERVRVGPGSARTEHDNWHVNWVPLAPSHSRPVSLALPDLPLHSHPVPMCPHFSLWLPCSPPHDI